MQPVRLRPRSVEALEGRVLLSAVSLVADIHPGTLPSRAAPQVVLGNDLLFTASQDSAGSTAQQVWKEDLTSGAVSLVKEFSPLIGAEITSSLVRLGDAVYFGAYDTNGTGLWRTDGTPAGTTLVKGFTRYGDLATAQTIGLTVVGDKLFFEADDDSHGPQLWVTDGTSAGTTMLTSIPRFSQPPYTVYAIWPTDLVPFGGKLFYMVDDGTQQQLWQTDGTVAGTAMVKGGLSEPPVIPMAATSQGLWFFVPSGPGEGLWKTDGVTTTQIIDVPGNPITGSDPTADNALVAVGDRLYFTGDNHLGRQLWTSDGTVAGTYVVQVSHTQTEPAPSALAPFNGNLLFSAFDGVRHGLWMSDGTAGGTVELATFAADLPAPPVTFGAAALFGADDGVHGQELWRTDGTPAGTRMLADINPLGGSNPSQILTVGGNAFFTADDGFFGAELWKTDGTPAGTHLEHDVNQAGSPSNPNYLTDAGGKLYFTATDLQGLRPFVSDGTAAGTLPLLEPVPSPAIPEFQFTSVNGAVYFTVPDPSGATALWKTDGTPAGTIELRAPDLTRGYDFVALTAVGNTLFFLARTGNTEMLFRSDGSDAGTVPVANFPLVSALVPFNGNLLVSDGSNVLTVYRTDGTIESQITLTAPAGWTIANPIQFPVAAAGTLYFLVEETSGYVGGVDNGGGSVRDELWRTDGTADGTHSLGLANSAVGPAYLDGELFFSGPDGSQIALYKTDGSTIVKVTDLPATSPYQARSATADDKLFFLLSTSAGAQLWESDGTAAGTKMVTPVSGDVYYVRFEMAALDGVLYYTGTDADRGDELWRTDGMAAGTFAAADIPGPLGSYVAHLTTSGDRLFFTAADTVHGNELWMLPGRGAISGSVFNDLNNDGVHQDVEAGVPGVTVFLDTNGNGLLDPAEPTSTTDANGNYRFEALPPGNYTVRELLPPGWRRTTPVPAATVVFVDAGVESVGPVFGTVLVSTVPLGFDYLVTLARNYGGPGTFASGDLNDDGKVDFADLVILARNYGHALSGQPAAATATLMPIMTDDLLRSRRRRR